MTKESEVRKWYMKGQYIPQLGTVEFAKFAAHGYSLMREIESKNPINYRIDPKSPTAYFDHRIQTIALPGWYFIPEGVAQFSDMEDPAGDALTLINGSTIHESLHAKYTKTTPSEVVGHVRSRMGFRVNPQLVASVANTVEDICVENNRHLNKYQREWLAAKNDLLFNDKIWERTVAELDRSNPLAVAESLCLFKRVELQSKLSSLVNPEIVELLEKVKEKNSFLTETAKTEITFEIVKRLIADAKESPEPKPEPGDGEPDPDGEESEFTGDGSPSKSDGETEKGEPESTSAGDEESEDEDESEEEPGETDSEDGEESESESEPEPEPEPEDYSSVDTTDKGEGAKGEEKEKLDEIIESERRKISKVENSFNGEAKKFEREFERDHDMKDAEFRLKKLRENIRIEDVTSWVGTYESDLQPIQLTNRFVALLKQMRTVLPQRGRGKLSGGKIDVLRLHQVAIDQKVFSVKTIEQTGNNDKVEIIMLVDGSGSMGCRSTKADGRSYNLYQTCLSVSNKIFKALVSSGVKAKVFAHTTYSDNNWPLIVKIADPRTRNFEVKFRQAMELTLHENVDGIIIEELANNHFESDSRTQKILLVLSDGSPQSPSYPYSVANSHTKYAIEMAREKGIKVYSISLVESVVEYNNNFYGTEYNINATENLDREMVNLVTKLVRRK